MTPFKNLVGSVLSKALLTGLVVTAIFSTPLQAREHRTGDRHTEQGVGASSRFEGERSIAAPAYHAFAPVPSDQPGGVCDHGDNPMICRASDLAGVRKDWRAVRSSK